MTSLPVSIRETAAALRRRALSCQEVVRACLERAARLQPQLNAFITLLPEQALAEAKARDAELAAGRGRGPLHGIPIVHKDLFDTAGVPTTAGSRLYAGRVPQRDAAVVRRLAEAGAVTLGKTNMNELAAGTSGKNVFHGDVRNPWDRARSPGGSSSGSAAAIAGGICLAGTGSDTGGSIRIPAACCGLVALRPGFGRLPLEGVTLRSYSLDTVGPLARTADGCALLYDAMCGFPPRAEPLRDDGALRDLRIGLPEGVAAPLDKEVRRAFENTLKLAAAAGARTQSIALRGLLDPGTLESTMDLMLFEFHEILRSDYRACERPQERLGPVVRANLERGARITAARYEECVRRANGFAHAAREALKTVDVLALPVLAAPTPSLDSGAEVYDRQRELTLPLGATRLPVIALPCGRDADGMPLGLQLAGRDGAEARLFEIAAALEPLVGWTQWRSPSAAG